MAEFITGVAIALGIFVCAGLLWWSCIGIGDAIGEIATNME